MCPGEPSILPTLTRGSALALRGREENVPRNSFKKWGVIIGRTILGIATLGISELIIRSIHRRRAMRAPTTPEDRRVFQTINNAQNDLYLPSSSQIRDRDAVARGSGDIGIEQERQDNWRDIFDLVKDLRFSFMSQEKKEELEREFNRNDLSEDVKKKAVITEGNKEINVCQLFFDSDLDRGDYILRDGRDTFILDRKRAAGVEGKNKERLKLEAVNRLKDFLDGDEDLLFRVSKYANQSSFGYVATEVIFYLVSHTPLKEGLKATQASSSRKYFFSKKESGEVELDMIATTYFKDIYFHNKKVLLDPQKSYLRYHLTLTIPRKGKVRVNRAEAEIKLQEK